MARRQIPVTDLIEYFRDQFVNNKDREYNSILEIIAEYVSIISEETILHFYTNKNVIFPDWCMFDHYIDNFPRASGILLYDGKHWGISEVYENGSEAGFVTEYCWVVDNNNKLSFFELSEFKWKYYGAMTKLFEYKDYQTNKYYSLGDRIITPGIIGRDVYCLQSLLKYFSDSVELTGVYDEKTINTYKDLQKAFNLSKINENFDIEQDELLCMLN